MASPAALRHAYSYHRPTAMQQKSAAPCKFWLQGRCNRSDACRFSHATANAPPPSPPRSSMSWRKPTGSTQEAPPAPEQQHSEAAPSIMPIPSENSAVEVTVNACVAPPEDTVNACVAPPEDTVNACVAPPEDTLNGIASTINGIATAASGSGGAATGICVANWPTLVVTGEDGSFGVDDLQWPKKRTMHKLHAYITCVVDGPVQQLLHPGLLLLGLASGEIAALSFFGEQQCGGVPPPAVQIISGPPQHCGKVLCLVSARTRQHSLLLIAGYENGAILCWTFDVSAGSFSPLRALQCPTTSSIVSMDISDDDEFGGYTSSSMGQMKKQLLYSASADGFITVWDLDTFGHLQLLPQPSPIVKLLTAGRYLFVGCADGTVKVCGPSSSPSSLHHEQWPEMELLYTQPSPRQEATSVVDLCGQRMENGSHMLFAAYNDNTVSMWELPSFNEVDVMRVSFGIRAMDVATRSPDGSAVLLLAGTGGSIAISVIQRRIGSSEVAS